MFTDRTIKSQIEGGGLFVHPFDPSLVQPASIDLTLGEDFIQYFDGDPIDPENPSENDLDRFSTNRLILYPHDFVLGTTVETVGVPSTVAARVEGKSTLGRLGLIVHSTAGFVDPGFKGKITLEMTNINVRPIILRAGMKICQIAFYPLVGTVDKPYGHKSLGSHYHGQTTVTPAASLKKI